MKHSICTNHLQSVVVALAQNIRENGTHPNTSEQNSKKPHQRQQQPAYSVTHRNIGPQQQIQVSDSQERYLKN